MPQLIPPRIIQTAKHRNLSLKQRAMTANLRLLNPDYEWRFFDNQDVETFIDREFPQHRPVFDAFRFPIQRYDFFRYLAVYRLGGFYFDLDVLLASDLSSLLPHGCVFPFEGLTFSHLLRSYGMDWEIGNYAFGAAAGDPFLEAVIENCVRSQKDPSWVEAMMRGVPRLSRPEHYVLYTTGPGVLSRTLAENPALAATVTVLFPDDVCDDRTWNVFGTFGVHLMEGTWRPSTSFARRRLAQKCEALAMRRVIRRSRRLGKTRHLVTSAQPVRA
jgi:inositol phosphorylceramide mannosyltransferase catalytic subunit